MLKFAHAAEIAAYHAYEGHWRSVSNQAEQDHIKNIQFDELKHIYTLKRILFTFGHRSNRYLDICGKAVGETVGFMCYHSGWRLPMIVAGLMEKIGASSYHEIALEAADNGQERLAWQLLNMAKNEEDHEVFFRKLRDSK